MSSAAGPSTGQAATPSSIFKSMLDTALAEYKKKTGNDLLAIWLASELQTCESVDSVLDVLRGQAKAFERSDDDEKLIKWIDPLVNVLFTFSDALGDGVSLAFPPAKVIFTGISALLGVRVLPPPLVPCLMFQYCRQRRMLEQATAP